MSTKEEGFAGRSVADVQDHFFLVDLPIASGGRFRFRKTGLHADAGTIVLFQYARRIVASAALLDSKRFALPDADGCAGAFVFDATTIRVFDAVDLAGLRKIWPKVTCLGQAKWSLDPKRYPAFEKSLQDVRTP